MREMEIIEIADSVKKVNGYFGGDHFLDMRRWFWRVGSSWIDIAYTEQFNRPTELPLAWDVDCPRCYVEFCDVSIAIADIGELEYVCLFDNQMKRYK